ncbi:MAG: ATP phosphoribosyltransferase regulatory subunit [Burkholderiales bacterium]
MIAAAIDILRAFGLGPADVQVRLSDRRVLKALLARRGIAESRAPAAFAVIDRSERVPRAVLEAMLREAGYEQRETAAVFEIAALRGKDAIQAGGEAAEPLDEAVRALEAMGLGDFLAIDLTIVRGLAYYTGIVFELFDAKKALRAICGGGRYDGLLASVGGAALPAVGFGMGDVVIAELLRARALLPPYAPAVDYFIIAWTDAEQPLQRRVAALLRARGASVLYPLKRTSMSRQLKEADARGARRVVLLGPDEVAAGVARVREMDTGEERNVPLDVLAGTGGRPEGGW